MVSLEIRGQYDIQEILCPPNEGFVANVMGTTDLTPQR